MERENTEKIKMPETIIEEDARFQGYYTLGQKDTPRLLAQVSVKVDKTQDCIEEVKKALHAHEALPLTIAHPRPARGPNKPTNAPNRKNRGALDPDTEAILDEQEQEGGLNITGRIPWDKFFKFLTLLAVILVIAAAGGSVLKAVTSGGFIIEASAVPTNQTDNETQEAHWHPEPVDHALEAVAWMAFAALFTLWYFQTYHKKNKATDLVTAVRDWYDSLYAIPAVKKYIDQEWTTVVLPSAEAHLKALLGEGKLFDEVLDQLKKWGREP